MNSSFEFLDYLIFGLYALMILGVGLWVSRTKNGKEKSIIESLEKSADVTLKFNHDLDIESI